MKKLVSLLLALLMVMGMAFAEDVEEEQAQTFALTRNVQYYTVKITDANPNRIYRAYQIFSGKQTDTDATLSDIEWGSGVNGDVLLGELNEKFEEFKDCSSAADIAEALAVHFTDDEKLREFADFVGQHITQATSETLGENTLNGLPAGYYLIMDEPGSQETEGAAYTAYILWVTKNTIIAPKFDAPTVDKVVDDADVNIGDTVTFTLTATMPGKLVGYETYKVVFHDTLSAGLTYNTDSVVIKLVDAETSEAKVITDKFTVTHENGELTISCDDVLAEDVGADVKDQIVVTYTATINENAVIGTDGNSNKVYLEYSNDPNGDGTGNTPVDEVKVYTWEIPVFKYIEVDGVKTPLAGAGFTLYKNDVAVNLVDAGNNVYKVCTKTGCTDHEHMNEIVTGATGKFEIEGLEQGTYVLKETTVPAGYNTAANTTITIGKDGVLSVEEGTVTVVEILNQKGSTLPSTGGMGTTVLYAVGGLLVLVAFVLIVSKRRASEN